MNEDSGAYTVSLTSYASDVQDAAGDLTWAVDEGETVVVYGNTPMPAEGLVSWSLTGHDLSITPTAEQFGMVQFNFTVTDSNGLEDDRSITSSSRTSTTLRKSASATPTATVWTP